MRVASGRGCRESLTGMSIHRLVLTSCSMRFMGKTGASISGPIGLPIRPERRQHRRGKVGCQVVPLPRDLAFVEKDLHILHVIHPVRGEAGRDAAGSLRIAGPTGAHSYHISLSKRGSAVGGTSARQRAQEQGCDAQSQRDMQEPQSSVLVVLRNASRAEPPEVSFLRSGGAVVIFPAGW